jgi:hypothetical protein
MCIIAIIPTLGISQHRYIHRSKSCKGALSDPSMPTSVVSQSGRAAPVKTKAKKGMKFVRTSWRAEVEPTPDEGTGTGTGAMLGRDLLPVRLALLLLPAAPVLSVQEQQSTEKRNDNHKPQGKTPSKQKLIQAKPKPRFHWNQD